MLEKDVLAKEMGVVERWNRRRSERDMSRASTPVKESKTRCSRTTIWLLAILSLVLILIIILGAVLGSLARSRHSVLQPSITEIPAGTTPTSTASTGATGIPSSAVPTPHIASISATGWSVPGPQGYNSIWLFWQDRQGYLSRAAYNSSTGNWTRVSNFVEAREKTPVAASTLDAKWYEDQQVSRCDGASRASRD